MKTLQHIEETIKIGNIDWKLTRKEKERIIKRIENFLGKNFCRMCRYCQECPKGMSVPDILKLLVIARNYGYVDFSKWQYSFFKDTIKKCDLCGKCEEKCPYGVPILDEIKNLLKILT
jgi:predicted aldo/keto reductase-like oxidoreductase